MQHKDVNVYCISYYFSLYEYLTFDAGFLDFL